MSNFNIEEIMPQTESATSISSNNTESPGTCPLDELQDLGTVVVMFFRVKNIRDSDKKSFSRTERSPNPFKTSRDKLEARYITLRVM